MGGSCARGPRSRLGIVWCRRGKSASSVVIILTLTGGRSKFYPGKIDRDRRDGTYDIAYDDGERETRVKVEFIKALDSDSEDDRRSSSKKPREGDKCEAEFKNTGKYYPGTVKRQHSDGTYEILFV